MKENGVTVNVHYIKSLTEQKIFQLYGRGDCPNAEEVCKNIVSLPCYHTLSWDEQSKIIELTKAWV
jgi:dTDP-4-amino-4,6-dideoxygalactose transaminase